MAQELLKSKFVIPAFAAAIFAIGLGCQQPAGTVEHPANPATRPSVSMDDVPELASPQVQPAPQTRPALTDYTILEVKGIVQVRTSGDQLWSKASAGTVLSTTSEFRVGLRSKLKFLTPEGRTVLADRLGMSTFKRAADLDVESELRAGPRLYEGPTTQSGVEHEGHIRTPGATLRVRG